VPALAPRATPEERASRKVGSLVSWTQTADGGWNGDDAEQDVRRGDDPREEELGDVDPDRDVENTCADVERQLTPACGEALAKI
jgi:hypothetical protein